MFRFSCRGIHDADFLVVMPVLCTSLHAGAHESSQEFLCDLQYVFISEDQACGDLLGSDVASMFPKHQKRKVVTIGICGVKS